MLGKVDSLAELLKIGGNLTESHVTAPTLIPLLQNEDTGTGITFGNLKLLIFQTTQTTK
jgi:hypothetical protein